MLQFISRYLSNDIAIGLGTINTLIYLKDKGTVLNEPSVIAIQNTSGDRDAIAAVGTEAKGIQGRAPRNIHIVHPMKDGVIAGFDTTEGMLGLLIKKVVGGGVVIPPRVVICVSGSSTQIEHKAIHDFAFATGTTSAYLTEEPMAAALGAGLSIEDAIGSMVASIGGGTTEIDILSLNGLAYPNSIRVGGDTFDKAIVHHLRRNRGVIIGGTTAEEVKKRIGMVLGNDKTIAITVRGRSLAEDTPRSVAATSDEVRKALSEPLNQIAYSVRLALELAPPELTDDITDRGLVLTDGGALLKGMDLLLVGTTGLPVDIAGEPLNCVVYEAGKVLDYVGTSSAMFVEDM